MRKRIRELDEHMAKRVFVILVLCSGSVFIAAFVHALLLSLAVSEPVSACVGLRPGNFGVISVVGYRTSLPLTVVSVLVTVFLAILIARYAFRWVDEGI